MPYVPYQLILWKRKSQMKGHGKLYNAQIRRKMSTGLGNMGNQKCPNLRAELISLCVGKTNQIFMTVNVL